MHRCLPRGPLILCLAGLLAAGRVAHAGIDDELAGFGEFRFGMSAAEAAGIAGTGEAVPDADGRASIESVVTIVGAPALRRLIFVADRLTSVVFVWSPGDEKARARCGELFARLADQIERRYAKPVLGSDQTSAEGPADTAFWSFPDGASISLVAVSGDGDGGAPPCRTTLNYKAPPPDADESDAED